MRLVKIVAGGRIFIIPQSKKDLTKYAVAAKLNKLAAAAARYYMAKKENICTECGFAAKSAAGLRGHRQFKHGIAPSLPLLPNKQQDRLVTRSELERLLGLAEEKQPSYLEERGLDLRNRSDATIKLRQWTKELDKRVTQLEINATIVKRLAQVEQRIRKLPEDVGRLQQQMIQLEANQKGLAKAAIADISLLILALNAHAHSDETGRVTFTLESELTERLGNSLKQAKAWAEQVKEEELIEEIAKTFERTEKRH